jgi:hypothetical protein
MRLTRLADAHGLGEHTNVRSFGLVGTALNMEECLLTCIIDEQDQIERVAGRLLESIGSASNMD